MCFVHLYTFIGINFNKLVASIIHHLNRVKLFLSNDQKMRRSNGSYNNELIK